MRHNTRFYSFFNYISITFGSFSLKLLKEWIKHRKNIIKNTQRIRYLKFCINNDIVPRHLHFLHQHNINLTHYRALDRYRRLNDLHMMRILRIELNDAFRSIHSSRVQILHLVKKITHCIPTYINNSFFKKQEQSLHYFHQKERQSMDKKIRWLFERKAKDSVQNVRKIKYYCQVPIKTAQSAEMRQHEKQFSFSPPTLHKENEQIIEVKIDPVHYSNKILSSPFDSVNDKWFINLSHFEIPYKVQCLLQLGQNFSIPSTNTKNNIIQLIKNIENNIIKLQQDTQNEIRNRSIPVIHNLTSQTLYKDHIDTQIIDLMKITNEFVKNNPNIIFTRADKGNITVALDKTEYLNKIDNMLKDTQTYSVINKEPIKKLTKEIQELLTGWKMKGYINNNLYNEIYCSDGNLPRAYGLPKIHKPGLTFRIIISSIDSPTYSLASYIHRIISKNIIKPQSHIENSYQLIKKLKGLSIEENYDLISLDVVSLFTNIPVNLAMDSVSNRWSHISKGTKISKSEFLKALKLILESTYFQFNNIIYKQKFGTPMGSPLSPIIAEIVLQDLERKALKLLNMEIPFYHRYVDDIALAAPRQKINECLNAFNSLHSRLQFTLETGGKRLNFLDVTIINNEGTIEFDWYKKPTFSGRVLNFLSHHPTSQKRGVIISMIDRVFLLSHPRFHEKNLRFVVETFISNGYPLQFIFETIRMRLKSLFNKQTKKQVTENNNEERTSWFVIPFIKKVTSQINSKIYRMD